MGRYLNIAFRTAMVLLRKGLTYSQEAAAAVCWQGFGKNTLRKPDIYAVELP